MECWWCPWVSWGDPQVRYPHCLMGELPDGARNRVHSICIPSMPSESPACSPPSCFLLHNCAAHLTTLDGVRKKWVFLESLVLTHTVIFPCGRNHVFKMSFLSLSYAALREECADKVKLTIPPQSIWSLIFFFFLLQWCAGTSLLDFWTSTQALLSVGDCINSVLWGGRW